MKTFTHDEIMSLYIITMPSGDLFYTFNQDMSGLQLLCRHHAVKTEFLHLFGSAQVMYKNLARIQAIFNQLAVNADSVGNLQASNAYLDEAANIDVTLKIAREGMREILRKSTGKGDNSA